VIYRKRPSDVENLGVAPTWLEFRNLQSTALFWDGVNWYLLEPPHVFELNRKESGAGRQASRGRGKSQQSPLLATFKKQQDAKVWRVL
jgi:hypothetical protein